MSQMVKGCFKLNFKNLQVPGGWGGQCTRLTPSVCSPDANPNGLKGQTPNRAASYFDHGLACMVHVSHQPWEWKHVPSFTLEEAYVNRYVQGSQHPTHLKNQGVEPTPLLQARVCADLGHPPHPTPYRSGDSSELEEVQWRRGGNCQNPHPRGLWANTRAFASNPRFSKMGKPWKKN